MNDYIAKNKAAWNKRALQHVKSEFYDMATWKEGRNSLKEIELELLGDVKGLKILHLQCHFGQDTLSLARMGAEVTGMDFSEEAIAQARSINAEMGLDARFICCDIYELDQHLDEEFDLVFTSYGVLGWLPDMERWAQMAARFVKPGGRFVMAEFHPVVWMFDDDFTKVQYKYDAPEAIVEEYEGSYASPDSGDQYESVGWNHGMAKVVQSLINAGIQIDRLQEYHYSPWNCFSGTEEIGPDRYIIKKLGDKIPMVYAVAGHKS